MQAESISGKLIVRQDAVYLSVLLVIGLVVGVYLIYTAVVVAQDGVTFLEYAKNLRIAPAETMKAEDQHPGYPFLIIAAHQIVGMISDEKTPFSWIYSAQAVTLLFRLMAIVVIYFWGKELVGARFSYLASLALILFPASAQYGSDALSDWPHMFFLMAGSLLLLRGAIGSKWWLFGLAGIFAGGGYLVRPECVQVVIYGSVWLLAQLLTSRRSMSRNKIILGLMVMLVGFSIFAGPYMNLKQSLFPKKEVAGIALYSDGCGDISIVQKEISGVTCIAGARPFTILESSIEIVDNVGETIMWFFLPALCVGVYCYVDRKAWWEPKQFFVIIPILLNVALMIWLQDKFGYMSKRHTLPLVVFCMPFLPFGVQKVAVWVDSILGKKSKKSYGCSHRESVMFLLLFACGVSIGIPKMLIPLHSESLFIRRAAQWLSENTDQGTCIAVFDSRIRFYSDRNCIFYDGVTVPGEAQYIVEECDGVDKKRLPGGGLSIEKIIEDKKGDTRAIIYSRVP